MADLVARITGLWRYPVKSCAGEAVQTLHLDADGWPIGDRGWAIADAQGELTWAGAHPQLNQVHARLAAETLSLQTREHSAQLPLAGGRPVSLRAWNGAHQGFDHFNGWDAGDAAAALLQAATGAPLRLVRLPADAQHRPGLNALHLLGDGSIQAWQQALPQPLNGPVQRARPNLLLSADDGGELPPFIEDMALEVRIGDLTLRPSMPCVRCIVPTLDPATGVAQPAALDALTRLSAERAPGAPVQFGIYLHGAARAGRLQLGDRVELSLDFGKL